MPANRATVPVQHPSFAEVIPDFEPRDRVVVDWCAPGSTQDPITNVVVADKDDKSVTLLFPSEQDASRFATALNGGVHLRLHLHHREGLVLPFSQGRARARSHDEAS